MIELYARDAGWEQEEPVSQVENPWYVIDPGPEARMLVAYYTPVAITRTIRPTFNDGMSHGSKLLHAQRLAAALNRVYSRPAKDLHVAPGADRGEDRQWS